MIVDLFAGGGGASLGISMALGREPDVAINHDPIAVAMHAANHPNTKHFLQDVWRVHPLWATSGQSVELAWFSPDCTHHSKARGGKPRDKNIRDLAWVVVEWARLVKPRVILLENVEEFREWGPLDENNQPIKALKGTIFKDWVRQLKKCGYRAEWRELRACDYGAPTSRNRLFLVARCDGEPIVWPTPTHGDAPDLVPYRTAAECIDWHRDCPSIFMTREEARTLKHQTGVQVRRPLADKTMRRIAMGMGKFVINSKRPFIVNLTHGVRVEDIDEPFRTITGANRGEKAIIAPTMIQTGYGEREGQAPRALDLQKPLGTVVAGGVKHALVSAFLAKHYTGVVGSDLARPIGTVTGVDHHSLVAAHLESMRGRSSGAAIDRPVPTLTGKAHEALVSSHLVKLRGTCRHGQPVTEPVPTITASGNHTGEVRALLLKYYGTAVGQNLNDPAATITAKARLGLVTVHIGGEPYVIADIGMRMLQPRELYRAQGFPDSYIIGRAGDRIISKTNQVKLCGNSVSPPNAAALVRANCGWLIDKRRAA